MADRNPSKQRRQAQNRANREARKARAEAAGMSIEDRRTVTSIEDESERPRRRRERRSREELSARAKQVIEENDSAEFGDDDDLDDQVVASQHPGPLEQSATRRKSSPVFSAKHRAHIAETTSGRAPARTHAGVGFATGVAVDSGLGRARPRPATAVATNGVTASPASGNARSRPKQATTKQATTKQVTTKTGSSARTARPSGSAPASGTSRRHPPTKQLPPWLDRFGGNDPGGLWVMLSFASILLASIAINFVHVLPEVAKNAKGKMVRTGRSFTIWHYGVGPGLYFLLPPILIVGLFILTARPSNRRRSWGIALMCLVFITYVTQSISVYLIPIACLAWGWWQARKAALDEVGGDPRLLREVDRERRIAERDALRERRASGSSKR